MEAPRPRNWTIETQPIVITVSAAYVSGLTSPVSALGRPRPESGLWRGSRIWHRAGVQHRVVSAAGCVWGRLDIGLASGLAFQRVAVNTKSALINYGDWSTD